MTDAEKQKLNEKLAKWAGFEEAGFGWFKKLGEPDPITLIQKVYRGMLTGALNFTNSLDACFKWLEPKLDDWKLQKDKDAVIAGAWLDNKYENDRNNNPALALCLAVEKLIEEK